LRFAERMRMAWDGTRAVLASKLPSSVRALPANLEVPTTAFTQHSVEVLANTSPAWLVNHGHRTFSWAMAFAARDDLRPDLELMYCASLLHDLGITERYLPEVGGCFALSGAKGAEDLLREKGMPQPRARVVAEAIALHLNVAVALDPHGPEAYLLRAGTACDVAGQDFLQIAQVFREATLKDFPRLDFKQGVAEAIGTQARQSPNARIGFLCKSLGLLGRVKRAPFDS
jgi:HD superfamily phosphodiesterase